MLSFFLFCFVFIKQEAYTLWLFFLPLPLKPQWVNSEHFHPGLKDRLRWKSRFFTCWTCLQGVTMYYNADDEQHKQSASWPMNFALLVQSTNGSLHKTCVFRVETIRSQSWQHAGVGLNIVEKSNLRVYFTFVGHLVHIGSSWESVSELLQC